jgi:hypothetical protein
VTVGRAEIAAGKVVDTATATGADAQRRSSPPSEPAALKIPTTRLDPRVTLTKRATVSPAGAQARLGGTISYSYTVTNVGHDALTAVWVDDPTIGPVVCPTPAPPGLTTGQSLVCTARRPHVVTAADAAAGTVVDRATAIGVGAATSDSVRSAPASVTVKVAKPGVAIGTDLGRWSATDAPLPAMFTWRHAHPAPAEPAVAIPALGVNAPLVAAGAIGAPGSAMLSVPREHRRGRLVGRDLHRRPPAAAGGRTGTRSPGGRHHRRSPRLPCGTRRVPRPPQGR